MGVLHQLLSIVHTAYTMAMTDKVVFLFTILVAVNAELPGVDWTTAFNKGTFESARCEIVNTIRDAMIERNFDFKLHCLGGIATVTYAGHMLNAIEIDECTPAHIKDRIRTHEITKTVTAMPNKATLYVVKGNMCGYKRYEFVNAINDVTPAKTYRISTCGTMPPVTFTECKEKDTKLTQNVLFVESGDTVLTWPSSMEIVATDPSKLLACSFQTTALKLQLLCSKDSTYRWFNVNANKFEDGYIVHISSEDGQRLARVHVVSCWENDIVGSIFPLKTSSSSLPVFRYSQQDGTCYEQQPGVTNELKGTDYINNMDQISCPSKDNADAVDAWFGPSAGKAGVWEKCTGPYSIKVYDPRL